MVWVEKIACETMDFIIIHQYGLKCFFFFLIFCIQNLQTLKILSLETFLIYIHSKEVDMGSINLAG